LQVRTDVIHGEAELGGARITKEAVRSYDIRVSGAGLEEAGLFHELGGVGAGAEVLDGHGLAGGAVARLLDDAEGAGAEEIVRHLVVLRAADADAPPLDSLRRPVAGVEDGRRSLAAGRCHDDPSLGCWERGRGEGLRDGEVGETVEEREEEDQGAMPSIEIDREPNSRLGFKAH
jgi:hypothetical protein